MMKIIAMSLENKIRVNASTVTLIHAFMYLRKARYLNYFETTMGTVYLHCQIIYRGNCFVGL